MANILAPGLAITTGGALVSANGQYEMVMQADGNLVLYRMADRRPMWATGTAGRGVGRAVMQVDGNFVLYTMAGGVVWQTNTARHPGSFLVLQDDGNVVIYQPTSPLWQSNTHQG